MPLKHVKPHSTSAVSFVPFYVVINLVDPVCSCAPLSVLTTVILAADSWYLGQVTCLHQSAALLSPPPSLPFSFGVCVVSRLLLALPATISSVISRWFKFLPDPLQKEMYFTVGGLFFLNSAPKCLFTSPMCGHVTTVLMSEGNLIPSHCSP